MPYRRAVLVLSSVLTNIWNHCGWLLLSEATSHRVKTKRLTRNALFCLITWKMNGESSKLIILHKYVSSNVLGASTSPALAISAGSLLYLPPYLTWNVLAAILHRRFAFCSGFTLVKHFRILNVSSVSLPSYALPLSTDEFFYYSLFYPSVTLLAGRWTLGVSHAIFGYWRPWLYATAWMWPLPCTEEWTPVSCKTLWILP